MSWVGLEDWRTLTDFLSLCEHHYRLGVLHGSEAKDSQDVLRVVDKADGYTEAEDISTGEVFNITKNGENRSYCRRLAVMGDRIGAHILCTHLVNNKAIGWRANHCAIIDYHYRLGLKKGNETRNIRAAREFYSKVGTGSRHDGYLSPVRKKALTIFEYFNLAFMRALTMKRIREDLGVDGARSLELLMMKYQTIITETRYKKKMEAKYGRLTDSAQVSYWNQSRKEDRDASSDELRYSPGLRSGGRY